MKRNIFLLLGIFSFLNSGIASSNLNLEKNSKFITIAKFVNEGTVVIPYVEMSDYDETESYSEIPPNAGFEAGFSITSPSIIEIIVQLPMIHPKCRIKIWDEYGVVYCSEFEANQYVIVMWTDSSPSYTYSILYDENPC